MPHSLRAGNLWEHFIATRGELAYVNAQLTWHRAEGPLPWRVGDRLRLPKKDMARFIAESQRLDMLPPPSILDLRRALTPMTKVHRVVAPNKKLP